MRATLRRPLVRLGFGAVGLAFVTYALLETWNQAQGQVLPGPVTIAWAALVVTLSLAGGGMSWYSLFGAGAPRRLITDFYLSQLGKYLPGGGVWQAASQVGLSIDRGVGVVRLSANFVVHAIFQLLAALTVGGLLVFSSQYPLWVRALSGLGLAAPLLLRRSWMANLLGKVGHRLRLDEADTEPPDQRTIIRSWLWSLLPITGFGAAYGFMAQSLEPGISVLWSGAAFAMAWAVGFVILPFPAGLGVREAVLVALVGGSIAVVMAASLVLRALAIAGDVILFLVSRRIRE